MSILIVLFTTLLFAFLYRCRGGFLGTGRTQVGRLVYWAIPVAIWGHCVLPWYGLLCGLGAFVGLLFSHGPFQVDSKGDSIGGMIGIGIARMYCILLPLTYSACPELNAVAIAGGLQGLAYFLGHTFLNGIDSRIYSPGLTLFGKQILTSGEFAIAGDQWGEVITGAFFGLTFGGILVFAV